MIFYNELKIAEIQAHNKALSYFYAAYNLKKKKKPYWVEKGETNTKNANPSSVSGYWDCIQSRYRKLEGSALFWQPKL